MFSNKSCVRAFDPLKIVDIRICESVSSETGQMEQWLRLLALLWKPKSIPLKGRTYSLCAYEVSTVTHLSHGSLCVLKHLTLCST